LQKKSCGLSIQVGQQWQICTKLKYYSLFPDKESTDSQEKIFFSSNRCDLTTRKLLRNIEFLLNPSTDST